MSVHFFRTQLKRLQVMTEDEPIRVERREQELVGSLLQWGKHGSVRFEAVDFPAFRSALAMPKERSGHGAVLYLHGGGYVCGDLNYAKGFGSVLCRETGMRSFVPPIVLRRNLLFPPRWKTRLPPTGGCWSSFQLKR